MARNSCPHLHTIVQINPAELCIQKKVNIARHSRIPEAIASQETWTQRQTTTTSSKKCLNPIYTYEEKCAKSCRNSSSAVFNCRVNCVPTALSQDPISGYVFIPNACTLDALTSITTTAHCISRWVQKLCFFPYCSLTLLFLVVSSCRSNEPLVSKSLVLSLRMRSLHP